MVHKFVNKFMACGQIKDPSYTKDDLIQIGWMLICEAVHQFDPNRGVKFSTFAFIKLSTKFANLAKCQRNYAKRCFDQEDDSFWFVKNGNYTGNKEHIKVSDNVMNLMESHEKRISLLNEISQFIDILTNNEKRVLYSYFYNGKCKKEMMYSNTKNNPKKYRARSKQIRQSIGNIKEKAKYCFV